MSIFMISPKVEPTSTETSSAQVEVTSDKSESDHKANPSEDNYIVEKEIDEKTIIVDGPLSKIYTEALNQIYAKEGYETVSTESLPVVNRSQYSNATYVFTLKDENLVGKGYLAAFESFRAGCDQYRNVFLCLEHEMDINPKVCHFTQYARAMGATILYDREHAVKKLTQSLTKSS